MNESCNILINHDACNILINHDDICTSPLEDMAMQLQHL